MANKNKYNLFWTEILACSYRINFKNNLKEKIFGILSFKRGRRDLKMLTGQNKCQIENKD